MMQDKGSNEVCPRSVVTSDDRAVARVLLAAEGSLEIEPIPDPKLPWWLRLFVEPPPKKSGKPKEKERRAAPTPVAGLPPLSR